MVFNKLTDARIEALKQSVANPKMYYIITSCFGWMVQGSKRLHTHSPSDATDWTGQTGTYWLNGVEKSFTTKQIIFDQNHGNDCE